MIIDKNFSPSRCTATYFSIVANVSGAVDLDWHISLLCTTSQNAQETIRAGALLDTSSIM